MAGIGIVEGNGDIRGASDKFEVHRTENVVVEVRTEILCCMGTLCLDVGGVRLDMVQEREASRLYVDFARRDWRLVAWSGVRGLMRGGNGRCSRNLG